jgi:hypothetical protein
MLIGAQPPKHRVTHLAGGRPFSGLGLSDEFRHYPRRYALVLDLRGKGDCGDRTCGLKLLTIE